MSYYYGPPPRQPRQMSGGTIALIVIGAGVGSILLLCVLCSSLSAIANRSQRISTSAPAFSTDVPLPTRPPAPTATPVPQPLADATIGGGADAFGGKYGDSFQVQGVPVFSYHTLGSGLDVNIFLNEQQQGTDGKAHVAIVQVALNPGEVWEEVQERTICGFFVPDDAHKVTEKTIDLGGVTDIETVYQSPGLAATFPASLFVDDQHNVLPPGTFALDYLPDLHVPTQPFYGSGHCELSLGSH